MQKWELHKLYREETGNGEPADYEFECFRSKGQWVVPRDTSFHERLERNNGVLIIPDLEYIEWMEEIVCKILNQ